MKINIGHKINNCRLCDVQPEKNEYKSDGSCYHTKEAIVYCPQCNIQVVEPAQADRHLDAMIGNGHEVDLAQYGRALESAVIKWNRLNKKQQPKKQKFDADSDITFVVNGIIKTNNVKILITGKNKDELSKDAIIFLESLGMREITWWWEYTDDNQTETEQ